ncbi:MAG: DUF2270 domain-containing protein [Chloroflexota bacterium]|nr:DUF2270 domain-containing protein [Chloroflexota bacterium]
MSSANRVNALIHLYRAEVGRMTAYRARLDTTTNWAITTSALVGTFALGNPEVSHVAFVFLMLLVYFFLLLEGRRLRHYEASRVRVELLERTFYPEMLGRGAEPGWVDQVLGLYREPVTPVGRYDAIGWRLRRNYLWIFLIILLTWVAKLDVVGGWTLDPFELIGRAAVGSLPGWLVCGLVALFYAWLAFLAIRAHRHYPFCEDW